MIRGSVFPHSRGGVVSAVMIGLGRAIGETIAVALVIGSSQHISAHILGPGDTLASIIANQFGEATGEPPRRAHRPGRRAVRAHARRRHPRPRGSSTRFDRRVGSGACEHGRPCRRPAVRSSRRGPRSRRRKVSNGVATGVIVARVRHRARPARRSSSSTWSSRARRCSSWAFLTDDLPFVDRLPGGGMAPGGRRHAADHRRGGADGDPARRARRHLPQRVRRHASARPARSASSPR